MTKAIPTTSSARTPSRAAERAALSALSADRSLRHSPLATFARWLGLATLALCLTSCAALPPPVRHEPTHAYDQPQTTRLGQLAASQTPNPRLSGLRLLISGQEEFGALAALIDNAEKTLDLQYYIVKNDASSRALVKRVVAAAHRGVRVRVLIDDMNTAGEDVPMLRVSAIENVEVRVYNPFPAGRSSMFGRIATSIADIDRINRRMHNKMLVADNAMAITGGRNLGDEYFLHSEVSNFLDIDVLAAGPVVGMLSQSFDQFWNSELAYPIGAIAAPDSIAKAKESEEPPLSSQRPSAFDKATAAVASEPDESGKRAPDIEIPADNPLALAIAQRKLNLTWAPATVISDRPSKIAEPVDEKNPARLREQDTVIDSIAALAANAKRSVVVITPYFVPGVRGMAALKAMVDKDVKVGVLTNSLATTDAPAVHIGYSRYREPMLAMGVELHELQPRLGEVRRSSLGSFGSSQASLHAKALVIDDRTVVVGSMNLDPRSANLNTEIGLVIQSPEIGRQITQLYQDIGRSGSWHVELDADKKLRWSSAPEGKPPEVLNSEPDASFSRKLMLKLLTPFAPESML